MPRSGVRASPGARILYSRNACGMILYHTIFMTNIHLEFKGNEFGTQYEVLNCKKTTMERSLTNLSFRIFMGRTRNRTLIAPMIVQSTIQWATQPSINL